MCAHARASVCVFFYSNLLRSFIGRAQHDKDDDTAAATGERAITVQELVTAAAKTVVLLPTRRGAARHGTASVVRQALVWLPRCAAAPRATESPSEVSRPRSACGVGKPAGHRAPAGGLPCVSQALHKVHLSPPSEVGVATQARTNY